VIDVLNYPFCRGRVFDSIEKDEKQYEEIVDIFWASGAAMVIKADLMQNFGGFDGDFFAHQEEIDLCWRLKNAGYRICYSPDSTVYHLGGGTLNYANPRKTYLNFRNNFISSFKNERTSQLLWKIPFRFFLDLLSVLKFVLSGQFGSAKAVLSALLYVITHPISINRKRQTAIRLNKKLMIGEPTKHGRFAKSIVWSYFILGRKTYGSL